MKFLVRWIARVCLGVAVLGMTLLVCLQFAQMVQRNVAAAAELRAIDDDVAALHAKKLSQEREIARLSDRYGVIPEIHDRLRLAGPHEAIIYLKGIGNDEH